MSSPTTDDPGKTALSAAAEFLKFSTTFTAAALGFSIGLLPDKLSLFLCGELALIASWILLAASLFGGVVVYGRIPIMLSRQNYNLEDGIFKWGGRVHHVAFILGILALGALLGSAVFLDQTSSYKVSTAKIAVDRIQDLLPKNTTIAAVLNVEQLPGVDKLRPETIVWHVQVQLKSNQKAAVPAAASAPALPASATTVVDYFLDAKTGACTAIPSR
jgi:hypothetical protein